MREQQVYLLENKFTDKKYVGMTSKGVAARFHKHMTNAFGGVKSHLYDSIRKHGIEAFTYKVLWRGKCRKKCMEMERHYIQHYDTYRTGYNQTMGGSGGWSVPPEKYESWLQSKIDQSTGKRNPKYIDISDEEILKLAYDYYQEKGKLIVSYWMNESKKLGIPRHYTAFRFNEYGGGRQGFKQAMMDVYGLTEESFKYKRLSEHNENIRQGVMKNYGSKNHETKTEETGL